MKKYTKLITNQVLIAFQYRFNLLTKIFLNLLQFGIVFFLWQGVYQTSQAKQIGQYTRDEMLIYLLVTNLITLLFNFNNIHRLGTLVRTGKLSTLLLRPLSLAKENFCYYLGEKLIVMGIFLLIVLLVNIAYKPLVIFYIFLAMLMFYYLTAVIATAGFWLLQTWSLKGLFNGIYFILAGIYFPLDLLPERLFAVIKYNPFSLVSYVLANVLESKVLWHDLLYYTGACLLWIILLKIAYLFLLRQGLRTYEGMGA